MEPTAGGGGRRGAGLHGPWGIGVSGSDGTPTAGGGVGGEPVRTPHGDRGPSGGMEPVRPRAAGVGSALPAGIKGSRDQMEPAAEAGPVSPRG